jgi:hypothetical protein
MIQITKLIRNERSVPIFSFLIGMGIMVLLFHKPYANYQSLTIPVSKIESAPIKVGEKCYAYKSEDVKCLKDKK